MVQTIKCPSVVVDNIILLLTLPNQASKSDIAGVTQQIGSGSYLDLLSWNVWDMGSFCIHLCYKKANPYQPLNRLHNVYCARLA